MVRKKRTGVLRSKGKRKNFQQAARTTTKVSRSFALVFAARMSTEAGEGGTREKIVSKRPREEATHCFPLQRDRASPKKRKKKCDSFLFFPFSHLMDKDVFGAVSGRNEAKACFIFQREKREIKRQHRSIGASNRARAVEASARGQREQKEERNPSSFAGGEGEEQGGENFLLDPFKEEIGEIPHQSLSLFSLRALVSQGTAAAPSVPF